MSEIKTTCTECNGRGYQTRFAGKDMQWRKCPAEACPVPREVAQANLREELAQAFPSGRQA